MRMVQSIAAETLDLCGDVATLRTYTWSAAMSDATNDTTHTDERMHFEQEIGVLALDEISRAIACACRECNHDLVHSLPGIRTVLKTAFAALTDLDRLAGPDDARYCKGCGQALELCEQVQQRDNVGCCYACFHPLIANDNRVAELEAELLRLAGPPCDYPPCARKRAVEHALCNPHDEQIYLDQCTRKHPRWPEGEAWLRARSAK